MVKVSPVNKRKDPAVLQFNTGWVTGMISSLFTQKQDGTSYLCQLRKNTHTHTHLFHLIKDTMGVTFPVAMTKTQTSSSNILSNECKETITKRKMFCFITLNSEIYESRKVFNISTLWFYDISSKSCQYAVGFFGDFLISWFWNSLLNIMIYYVKKIYSLTIQVISSGSFTYSPKVSLMNILWSRQGHHVGQGSEMVLTGPDLMFHKSQSNITTSLTDAKKNYLSHKAERNYEAIKLIQSLKC